MAEMLINNWWWWIWDDSFLARDGECLDMDWIDIRTTPRKISCAETTFWLYAVVTNDQNDTLNYVTETIDWVVQSYNSRCYIYSTNISSIAWADRHITVWSNSQDYNATTNPEWVRHLFFTYDNATNPIKVLGYSWWARTVLQTINTSGWASPANIRNARTTAVAYVWTGAILFSRDNLIFEFNPWTNTLLTGATTPTQNAWARIILEIGAVVKDIYYYSWQVVVLYNVGNTQKTTTYSVVPDSSQPNWYYYRENAYIDKQIGNKCLDSVSNWQFIYWISPEWIWAYTWSSQLVKKLTLSSWAVCSYNKWILTIGDGTTLYEYGVQKPWYGSPLTKKTVTLPIQWITDTRIVVFQSWVNQFRLDAVVGGYKATNTYITHPYTAWQFWVDKKWLGIRIGYTLPKATYTGTQCSIEIAIQTDDMYYTNTNTFVTIATITDKTKTSKDIMFTDISKALWDSWYSDDFSYFRLKITLKAWNEFAWYGWTIYQRTPEVFDVYISHEEIKLSI